MSVSTNNPMSPADMKAVLGNGNNYNDGMMGIGGNWFVWIIVLFLFAMIGGNWGGNNACNGGNGGGDRIVPVAVQAPSYASAASDAYAGGMVQRGFDQAEIMGALGDLSVGQVNGFANAQQSMCSGFGGVTAAVRNGFADAEISANSRQMATMQQGFNAQIAAMQAMNSLQQALNQCCCDNRAATADLKYTVATEACNDRAAVTDGVQNLTMQGINNTNNVVNELRSGFQSLRDQMCQDKMDRKDDLIAQLRSELMYARGQQSQDVQTATITAGQANLAVGQRNLANEIEQYINPTPKPAFIVQNPNGCNCGNYQPQPPCSGQGYYY